MLLMLSYCINDASDDEKHNLINFLEAEEQLTNLENKETLEHLTKAILNDSRIFPSLN